MKIATSKSLVKNSFIGFLPVLMLFTFTTTACGKKFVFLSSSVVPAAKGHVIVKNDKNKNYVLNVNESNLAEASRLQPSKQTYVVWMLTD